MDHSPNSGLTDAATLFVRHPSVCQNQQLICSLLRVSRGMRDCISQHAPHGLLPVSLHRRQYLTAAQAAAAERAAFQLASWLRAYNSLVGSISLSLPRSVMDAAVQDGITVQDAITAALQHAAALHPGLLLRSFTASIDSTALLQCLPSVHLTRLEFACDSDDATAQVADILAGLTGLCRLRVLEGNLFANHGPFLEVLGAHTRLTSLEVGHVGGAEYGENLPASLQKLHIIRYRDAHPMHLEHATALTDLSFDEYEDGYGLPPNVQLLKLQGSCGTSVGPFVALQHLRELHLGAAEYLPQADLVQLRDLTALSRLTLVYFHHYPAADAFLDRAAQACRQLTCLRELRMPYQPATARRLQAVGSLAQYLESLTLSCHGPGTHLVVDTLRMLTSLTRLSLKEFSDQHLAALRDMPQLGDLELEDVDDEEEKEEALSMDAAASLARAQHLATATQLTKLVCARGGVDDVVLSLSAMTGLRHLGIYGSWCTDAVVPVIARTMPHLSQLDVGRKFSAEGRAVLAAARPELLLTWW